MSLNGRFNPLRLNANVTLGDGGGAVLQKPLDKGNVVAVGLVDFRSIPLAETVSTDVPTFILHLRYSAGGFQFYAVAKNLDLC